ncbi:hypothetical protein [Pedobacter nyackensis]|uniref:Uncharacterized protein n=1 Tax=Pedobacter nyackensis TaxID=475255 RepID=A0A1W1ZXA4_9SPHI|nr:hypothetical protein [Pedobacter nyackensis]SMC53050.1 hypothetical protein SAMN04488101_101125 [Pedobacter nyackensis]
MKTISVDPDFTIKDSETDLVIYKGCRKYGGIKWFNLLNRILNKKQMLSWIDDKGGFEFKITNEKYDLILKEDNNG